MSPQHGVTAGQLRPDYVVYLELPNGDRWDLEAGSVSVTSDVEYIRSDMNYKPAVGWTHTDPAGHDHSYVLDGDGVPRLPTLECRLVHRDCNGGCGDHACEGYDVTVWHCRECDAVVEPGFVRDTAPIPLWATNEHRLTVLHNRPIPNLVAAATLVWEQDGEVTARRGLHYLSGSETWMASDSTTMRTRFTATERVSIPQKEVGP